MSIEQDTIYASLAQLQKEIYENNVKAGWWSALGTGDSVETMQLKPRGDVELILSKLALVHSEVSECVEGVRKGMMDDHLPHRPMAEVELADAVIRIFDVSGHEGWDLAGAIREKLLYNQSRLDHKIENRLKDNGKKA